MRINSFSTGFIEIPGQISMNIFTQGCSIKCKKCHNPELQNFNDGIEFDWAAFDKNLQPVEFSPWICWLGGEPTEHLNDLRQFNKNLKKLGYFIALYSGRTFEELQDLKILDDLDLIKTGRYDGYSVQNPKTTQRFYYRNYADYKNCSWVTCNYENLECDINRFIIDKNKG